MKRLFIRVAALVVCFAATSASAATLTVPLGGDLQGALNAAQPGDTILIEAGAVFTGNYVLPAKTGSGVITVRSAAADADLPATNVRMTPDYARLLPKLQSDSNGPALRTAASASGWRLLFLEFRPKPNTTTAALVEFGQTGSAQTSLSQVPSGLEIDRCFLQGDAQVGQRRGLGLNSGDTRVVNSYFSDFKGKNQDTQAIAGWNGPGPYLIENNYLEASGENIMFGGSDPSIPNLVPSNITIRHNLVSRPMAWMTAGWTVKNLLELKNAEHLLIEGNVFENHWMGGQAGSAIVFTPRNQSHGAPWSVVRHVVFQNNIVRHVSSGFNILGYDNLAPSQRTEDILVRNNLLYDVASHYSASSSAAPARFILIGAAPQDVRFDHNTVDNNGSATVFFYAGSSPFGPAIPGFELTNNLLRNNSWALYGDAVGDGDVALAHFASGGLVLHNTFAGAAVKRYPGGNDFPSVAQWLADFADPQGGNYRLRAGSLSHAAGTDGKDIGVDYAELDAALTGTGSVGVPSPTPTPPPAPTPAPVPPPAPAPKPVPVVSPTMAFGGTPAALPGRVQIENYDLGGSGKAYKDTTTGNGGSVYRPDGVDIQPTTDVGGGYDVAWVKAGEWLNYSVNVTKSGSFVFDVRVASRGTGGRFHVEVDGHNVTGTMSVANTGGWQTWRTLTSKKVSLTAGAHVVRLVMDANGTRGYVANFNWFAIR